MHFQSTRYYKYQQPYEVRMIKPYKHGDMRWRNDNNNNPKVISTALVRVMSKLGNTAGNDSKNVKWYKYNNYKNVSFIMKIKWTW